MRKASVSPPRSGQRRGRRGGVSTVTVTLSLVGMLCTLMLWNNRKLHRYFAVENQNPVSDAPREQVRLAVLVSSSRANFKQRQAIRETWGSGYEQNVFFLVGRACSDLQQLNISTVTCDEKQKASVKRRLYRERLTHGDLIVLNATDTQQAAMLRDGLTELVQTNRGDRFEWFARVNDGMVVRIGPLNQYLRHVQHGQSIYPATNATVFGQIVDAGAPVWKSGPYADEQYNQSEYPTWPRGPSGWVVSRRIAQHVADYASELLLSQSADTSLGIWMDEAPFSVQWYSDTMLFRNQGECYDPEALIIGNKLSVDQIRACFGNHQKTFTATSAVQVVPAAKPMKPPFAALPKKDADTSMQDTTIPSKWKEPPINKDSSLAVIVLSARRNFERRQTIRETWAANQSVYFVVGTKCDIPLSQRQNMTCIKEAPKNDTTNATSRRLLWGNHDDDNALIKEQEQYKDIVMVAIKESYRSLPHKLLGGTAWLVKHTKIQWIAKTDDDMVMRVPGLEEYLKSLHPQTPTVIGDIVWDAPVNRDGKWAELYYPRTTYPAWPRGAAGYVFSRSIGEYLSSSDNKLFKYQGEDTSFGIWMDESPFKSRIKWIRTKMFSYDGNCLENEYYIMGHDMEPDQIRKCHNATISRANHSSNAGNEQMSDTASNIFSRRTLSI